MAHTPEPWTVDRSSFQSSDTNKPGWVGLVSIESGDTAITSACSCCQGLNMRVDDIERLLLCVNACKGWSDAALQSVVLGELRFTLTAPTRR